MHIYIYIYKILHGCLVTQSCPTLFNPVDCSLPGSSVHGDSPGKNTGVMYIDKHIYTYIYAYLFFLLLKTSLYEAFEIEKKNETKERSIIKISDYLSVFSSVPFSLFRV